MRCPKRRHRGFLEFDMQEESNSFAKTPKKAVNRQSIKDINTFCIDEFYFCTNQKLDENLLSNQLQSVNVSKFHKIRKTTLCENVENVLKPDPNQEYQLDKKLSSKENE